MFASVCCISPFARHFYCVMTNVSIVEPAAFPVIGVAADINNVIVSAAAFLVESWLRVFECFTFSSRHHSLMTTLHLKFFVSSRPQSRSIYTLRNEYDAVAAQCINRPLKCWLSAVQTMISREMEVTRFRGHMFRC